MATNIDINLDSNANLSEITAIARRQAREYYQEQLRLKELEGKDKPRKEVLNSSVKHLKQKPAAYNRPPTAGGAGLEFYDPPFTWHWTMGEAIRGRSSNFRLSSRNLGDPDKPYLYDKKAGIQVNKENPYAWAIAGVTRRGLTNHVIAEYSNGVIASPDKQDYLVVDDPLWNDRGGTFVLSSDFSDYWQKTGSSLIQTTGPGDQPYEYYKITGTLKCAVFSRLRPVNSHVSHVTLPLSDSRSIRIDWYIEEGFAPLWLEVPVIYCDLVDSDGDPSTTYEQGGTLWSYSDYLAALSADAYDPNTDSYHYWVDSDPSNFQTFLHPNLDPDDKLVFKAYLIENSAVNQIPCPQFFQDLITSCMEINENWDGSGEYSWFYIGNEIVLDRGYTSTTIREPDYFSENGDAYNRFKVSLWGDYGYNYNYGSTGYDDLQLSPPTRLFYSPEIAPGAQYGSTYSQRVYFAINELSKKFLGIDYLSGIQRDQYADSAYPLPAISVVQPPFSFLYSADQRPSDIPIDNIWFNAYNSASNPNFMYKATLSYGSLVPSPGVGDISLLETQGYYLITRDIDVNSVLFLDGWYLSDVNLPALAPPVSLPEEDGYYRDNLIITCPGFYSNFCILAARALGFSSSHTGLTTEEIQAQE